MRSSENGPPLLFMKQRQQVIEIRLCRRVVSKGAARIWMSKVLNMVTRSELFYDVVPRHVSATLGGEMFRKAISNSQVY